MWLQALPSSVGEMAQAKNSRGEARGGAEESVDIASKGTHAGPM